MYTISYSCDLENCKTYEVKVEPPKEKAAFFEKATFFRHLRYKIKYTRKSHEILCPEYITENGPHVVVPWFFIFGRPYPIQIYLFVCEMYSANHTRGQRWAAEETRKKFELETFSHTTLGRAFRKIEELRNKALKSRFGNEMKACVDEENPSGNITKVPTDDEKRTTQGRRRFPSVVDTFDRRTEMANFLKTFSKAQKNDGIEAAGRKFVKHWYDKTKQLLL